MTDGCSVDFMKTDGFILRLIPSIPPMAGLEYILGKLQEWTISVIISPIPLFQMTPWILGTLTYPGADITVLPAICFFRFCTLGPIVGRECQVCFIPTENIRILLP